VAPTTGRHLSSWRRGEGWLRISYCLFSPVPPSLAEERHASVDFDLFNEFDASAIKACLNSLLGSGSLAEVSKTSLHLGPVPSVLQAPTV
jgi:hypothetical protein